LVCGLLFGGDKLAAQIVIPQSQAVSLALPGIDGDGVFIDVYNRIGGGQPPTPALIAGREPTGSTLSPIVDFPRPGVVVAVGQSFATFFADTTHPPDELLGVAASNFTLKITTLLKITPELDRNPQTPGVDIRLGIGSDDGFHLTVGTTFLGQAGDRGFNYSWFDVSFEGPGLYPVQLLFSANTVGVSGLEMSWQTPRNSGNPEIIPQSFLYVSEQTCDRQIVFEEFPVGTSVTDQYRDRGLLVNVTSGDVQITDAFPLSFVPVTPDRVFADPNASPADPGIVEFTFVLPGTDTPATTDIFSYYIIDAEATGSTVTAYDLDDNVLFTASYHGGGASREQVTIEDSAIARVVVNLGQGDDTSAMDSMCFSTPRAIVIPAITSLPDDTVIEGTAYTGPTPVLTQGTPPITWSLVTGPDDMNIDPATGVVSWANASPDGSPYTITIGASNVAGSTEETWLLTVIRPPVIAPISDGTALETQVYTRAAPTLTQGTPPITWTLIAPPAGMTIDPNTGMITWPNVSPAGSPYTITVEATNAAGSDQESWQLTVKPPPPIIADIPDGSTPELVAYTGPTPGLTQGAPPVVWSLVNGPAGMTIDPATGVVSWNSPKGSATAYSVTIQATNESGSDAETWLLTVPVTYTATVSADVGTAPAGTPVLFTGHAFKVDNGDPAPNAQVTIRVRVQGTRRVISALSDAQGDFQALFQPLPTEAGFYEVGADHPGVPTDSTQDTFILVGMRANPQNSSPTVPPGGQGQSQFTLRNLGDTPLSGITAMAQNLPADVDVQITAPDTLAPLQEVEVSYTVTSTGAAQIQATIPLVFTSAQNATTSHTLDLAVRPPQPVLQSDPPELAAGMVRGQQTIVQCVLTNTGGSPTGSLDVQIPDRPWLSVVSPDPIESLAPGESTTLEFQLLPADDLVLGTYTGTIVVGHTGVVSLTIPYSFTAISDAKGDLRVIAEDEFTYYGEGNPPVAGATVILKNPDTGAEVASGVTGADGVVFPDLTEAYYRFEVSAPDHQSASGTVLVAAGREKTIRPFLPREVVRYNWNVTPTTIPDVYRLTIDATFETHVPAPVVTIEPAHVDLDTLACDAQIDFTITNHGLITAEDLRFNVASSSRWELTPLVTEFGDLPARTSIVVPVRFHDKLCAGQVQVKSRRAASGGCDNPVAQALWDLVCGTKRTYGVPVTMTQARSCPVGSPGGGGGLVGGGGGGGGVISFDPVPTTKKPCDPCDFDRAVALAECLLGAIPGPAGCTFSVASTIKSCATQSFGSCVTSGIGAALGCLGGPVGGLLGFGLCLSQLPQCDGTTPGSAPPGDIDRGLAIYKALTGESAAANGSPGTAVAAAYLDLQVQRVLTILDFWSYFFGDPIWVRTDPSDVTIHQAWISAFLSAAGESSDGAAAVTADEEAQLRALPLAGPLTQDHITALLERWNRSVEYWSQNIFEVGDVPAGQSTDFIAHDVYNQKADAAAAAAQASQDEGFVDLADGVNHAVNALQDALDNPSEGICARVKIRIEQEAVVSRNAFLATLEIFNDSDSRTIEAISVELHIEDADGNPADDRFGILPPALTGLSDVSGGGSLGPMSSGKAQWTLIPTNTAAPTEPTVYRVSGVFAYMLDGQLLTIPLFPEEITVLPDPVLTVDYFLERIVYSDDPFTPDIEPPVPFSLGIMVSNSGAGEASDFHITTAQPRIIENEKGLLIAFNIVGSQVGDQPGTPSLTLNLGDIPPDSRKSARWLMTSSLQGQFIDFEATFEHVNPLGIEGLSLIDSVSIHELNHTMRVDQPVDDGSPDFLVNDTVDLQLLPDVIYSSDGQLLEVHAVTGAAADGSIDPPALETTLTVQPTHTGWIYIRADDPASQQFRLAGVRRADGTFVRLTDNAWRTYRIVRIQGQPPREEKFLHIVDYFSDAEPRTYTLTYEPADGFVPADLDQNGIIDGIDWGLFLTARGRAEGEPGYNPTADLDGDGQVTLVDQQLWLAAYRAWLNDPQAQPPAPIFPPTGFMGDLDGDQDVDLDDTAAFRACSQGASVAITASCKKADFDGDGDVDQSDFGLLQRCYSSAGKTPAQSCQQ
jgi:hypothetical protein